MAKKSINELVFAGRDNTAVLTVSQDGADIDSSSITRTLIEGVGKTLIIDSADSPNALQWSGTNLTLALGMLDIQPDSYLVRISIFTPTDPDGLVIQHEESMPQLWLKFLA